MKIKDIIEKLNLQSFNLIDDETEVKGAYASDLLSDVMGNASEKQVWITLQTHQNVAAIANLKDLAAVILINGNSPNQDMLEYAKDNSVNILGTNLSCFELCGKLYNILY